MKASTLRLRKLTLSGILIAMTVVLLYVGSAVDILDLTLSAVASFFVAFAVTEMGEKYPLLIYLAGSILSLLLLPNKLPAVLYTVMMGFYPLVKFPMERLHFVWSWIVKILFFNAALTVIVWLTEFVLAIPDTGFGFEIPVYLLGNVTYVLFDIAMSRLIEAYARVWRKRFRVNRFFGA